MEVNVRKNTYIVRGWYTYVIIGLLEGNIFFTSRKNYSGYFTEKSSALLPLIKFHFKVWI